MSIAIAHHDGSALYVPDQTPSPGGTVTLFVRVPHGGGVSSVHVRTVVDGEPRFTAASPDRRDEVETWWRVDVELHNPVTNYRFLLVRGDGAGRRRPVWLNGSGVHRTDVTDVDDFRVVTFDPPPRWAADARLYQIFPDRYSRSKTSSDLPPWAVPAGWDDPVVRDGDDAMHQLYGGDLDGIVQRIDHLERLGVNTIYLTPFFPARSNHRYNATSFSYADPVLGGDPALVRLSSALHQRGMRLIGDLTLNHAGDHHEWFRAAQRHPDAAEVGFFHFRQHPDDYAMWLGVPTLPKFDHRSDELARRLYDGADSVVAHWMRSPFDLDGWRIDVANMAGRYGDVDVNHRVARAVRRTMGHVRPDSLLLAEHCHDASGDLLGDGWHGTMFYAGFTRPLWSWLGRSDVDLELLGSPFPLAPMSGPAAMRTMRSFAATIPWRSFIHSMTLLGSHDTTRWSTAAGDLERAVVGAGVLFTYPGLPSIFAGDEIGLQGMGAEEARRPFPWATEVWDQRVFEHYRALIGLRRASVALRHGGLRWVHAGDDTLVYLREHRDERLLVQAIRAPHDPVVLPSAQLGCAPLAEHVLGGPELRSTEGRVTLPADGPAFHVWRL